MGFLSWFFSRSGDDALPTTYYNIATKDLTEAIKLDQHAWYNHIINLPIKAQVAYSTIRYHNRIEYRGFMEYFYSKEAIFAYLSLEHLKLIKAFDHAQILEEALQKIAPARLPAEEFRDIIFNRQSTEYFDNRDEFDDLHRRFNLLRDRDLNKLLTEYLKS